MVIADKRKPIRKVTIRLVLLCIILSLCGCASLKQTSLDSMHEISELQLFDGTYENLTSDHEGSEFSSLWNQLILKNEIDTLDFKNAKIRLKAIGRSQIKATWLDRGLEKKSIVLKGKLKGNYFVSQHKRTIIPIPLIYGMIRNNQFQLWLDQDSQLRVDRLQNRWGWIFVFLAGTDNTSNYKYIKVKE